MFLGCANFFLSTAYKWIRFSHFAHLQIGYNCSVLKYPVGMTGIRNRAQDYHPSGTKCRPCPSLSHTCPSKRVCSLLELISQRFVIRDIWYEVSEFWISANGGHGVDQIRLWHWNRYRNKIEFFMQVQISVKFGGALIFSDVLHGGE